MISFKMFVGMLIIFFLAYLFMFGTIPEVIDTIIFYVQNTSLSDLLFSNVAVIGIGLLIFLFALVFLGYEGEKRYF